MKKSLKTFALLSMSGLMLTAVAPHVMAQDDSQETTSEESVSSEESSENTDEAQAEESDIQVALNEAVALFQEEYPDAEIEELEVELRNEEYKITIHGFQDNTEYEVEFSVDPVEITKTEEDGDDDSDDEALNLEALITIDEASEIALEEAGSGTITDWSLDSDDGQFRWDIEVEGAEGATATNDDDDDDNKLHVEIDAETGDVLDVEIDD